MSDEHRPRPDDHLVEPMYEALREEAGPEPPPRRARLGCAVLLVAVGTGAIAAL